MPLSDERWDVVRIVEGVSGRVALRMELVVRFDYGSIVPWVRRCNEVLLMTAGPDTLELAASVELAGENMKTVAQFGVEAGQRESFVLNYRPSHHATRAAVDAYEELNKTAGLWHRWSRRCSYRGRWQAAVMRSLITLKGLTYKPSGGTVAAATTSLPEQPGGVRNWDYRYCWLRDATFTLNALLLTGYIEEATDWREWLLRAVAGSPNDLQILDVYKRQFSWWPLRRGRGGNEIGGVGRRIIERHVLPGIERGAQGRAPFGCLGEYLRTLVPNVLTLVACLDHDLQRHPVRGRTGLDTLGMPDGAAAELQNHIFTQIREAVSYTHLDVYKRQG